MWPAALLFASDFLATRAFLLGVGDLLRGLATRLAGDLLDEPLRGVERVDTIVGTTNRQMQIINQKVRDRQF